MSQESTGKESYLSVELGDVFVAEPLPVRIYLHLGFRFITFRAEEDVLDRETRDRLEMKRVKHVFILDRERAKFQAWHKQKTDALKAPAAEPEMKALRSATEITQKDLQNLFRAQHTDKSISAAIQSSRLLVNEIIKLPYAARALTQLQTYSNGTVDHSVNVSVLSSYLAMQMGYTHQMILQHIGLGALLHDIGKTKVDVKDDDSAEEIERKMRLHPELGVEVLEEMEDVPSEVKMIVAQHHESNDGTGFPKKMRGNSIYDLAKIVIIANSFDELVADEQGTLAERQKKAVMKMDQVLYKRFDPAKLEKALKILKAGV